MSAITIHVLDIMRGQPASGIAVLLHNLSSTNEWALLASGITDGEGRIRDLVDVRHPLAAGSYRLTFETAEYFRSLGAASFYAEVTVTFLIEDPIEHYHIPLLLSPYGYSTYRGR
jgi:5-hydroxyisourate hydrolase